MSVRRRRSASSRVISSVPAAFWRSELVHLPDQPHVLGRVLLEGGILVQPHDELLGEEVRLEKVGHLLEDLPGLDALVRARGSLEGIHERDLELVLPLDLREGRERPSGLRPSASSLLLFRCPSE